MLHLRGDNSEIHIRMCVENHTEPQEDSLDPDRLDGASSLPQNYVSGGVRWTRARVWASGLTRKWTGKPSQTWTSLGFTTPVINAISVPTRRENNHVGRYGIRKLGVLTKKVWLWYCVCGVAVWTQWGVQEFPKGEGRKFSSFKINENVPFHTKKYGYYALSFPVKPFVLLYEFRGRGGGHGGHVSGNWTYIVIHSRRTEISM